MPAIPLVTLLVREYDEAIAYFTGILRFTLIEDSALGADRRWVVVSPPGGGGGASLLLARASTPEQASQVGKQAGGRVAFFLHTDAFARDYVEMTARGAVFEESPREEAYGTVAVFKDLYGNRWDLVEPRERIDGAHSKP